MSDDDIRIAVAEARGYKIVGKQTAHYGETKIVSDLWADPTGERHGTLGSGLMPLYTSDLNAMHEAEKGLTKDQHVKFSWMLVQLLDNFDVWEPHEYETIIVWEMSLHDISGCLRATARQRAEAFLRTIGKWKES